MLDSYLDDNINPPAAPFPPAPHAIRPIGVISLSEPLPPRPNPRPTRQRPRGGRRGWSPEEPPAAKGVACLGLLCGLQGRLVCTQVVGLLASPLEEELTLRPRG